MSAQISPATLFILTLEGLEGVGRVTARKIASHWDDQFDFQRFPKEQALVRLKGVANAAKLVDKLNDPSFINQKLAEKKEWVEANLKRQIGLMSFKDILWPERLESLKDTTLANILYTYGSQHLLSSSSFCFLGRHGISPYAHEKAQDLARFLLDHEITISSTIQSGFDVVLHKLCHDRDQATPSIMAAASGLAKTSKEYRSFVSRNVKSGGLFYSPFEPEHGPFDHDLGQVLKMQVGISPAVVFVDPHEDERQVELMRFAADQKKAVFYISKTPGDPSGRNARRIDDSTSMKWALASVQNL